jgi:hypothetical protein
MNWSRGRDSTRIIFLVGDAPPHMDYSNGPKYRDLCQQAVRQDLVINTVQCGEMAKTTLVWKEIAQLAEGSYAAIAQSGNMALTATPMDDSLAVLNRELGRTLVGYGSQRQVVAAKQLAAEAAPAAVAADRLAFNATSGVAVQGEGELLDSLSTGKVKVETLNKAELPPELRTLDENDLKTELENRQKQRAELQTKIQKLSQERAAYLVAERKRLESQGKADSFDAKVAASIREQAARKGIVYGK